VRDHYHLKSSIWPKQIGENLHFQIKEHPEAALNCMTKEDYDFHVQQTYEALAEYLFTHHTSRSGLISLNPLQNMKS